MPRPKRISQLLLTTLVSVAALSGGAAAAPAASAAPVEYFTGAAASVVAPPQPVEGADGRTHLAYELLLINRSLPPAKIQVRSIETLAGGKVVDSLKGKALAAVMFPFGKEEPGSELGRGEAGYVLMDVTLPRGAKVPKRLSHRFSISLRPASDVIATRFEAAPTGVDRRPATVVSPPLRGDGWIVGNGCCSELTSHRAAYLAVDGSLHESERYAIDFIQITPSGLLGTGPLEDLSSYPFFGDDVLSAAAGRVVSVVDGHPETAPGLLPPSSAAAAAGNHVIVKLGEKRYALYAHLQRGSIRVREGQRVGVGETIALLGSSGNSNAPHLHFQLMDAPLVVGSNGVPYEFDRFTVAGTLTNFGGLFDGQAAKIAPRFHGQHRDELPLNLQVIGFAG